MTITVRRAAEDDVMALAALYADLNPSDPVLPAEQAVRIWREIVSQAGRAALIASRDGVPVGTVDCLVVPNLTRGGRPHMLVENVVVAGGARRQGVASRLFDALTQLARDTGCYKCSCFPALTAPMPTRSTPHVAFSPAPRATASISANHRSPARGQVIAMENPRTNSTGHRSGTAAHRQEMLIP